MELVVRSELAEASLHLVNIRLSEYEATAAPEPVASPAPRLPRARSLYMVGRRSAGLETVMRVATIAEVFASERMFQLGFQLAAAEFPARAWEHVADGVQSWQDRDAAWNSVFELKLNRFPRWRELQALIAARNIVAHGLGTLTRKQVVRGVAKEGIANKLALLDIKLDGLDLVVNERQVHRCAALVVEFITWLDSHPEAQRHRWEARAS